MTSDESKPVKVEVKSEFTSPRKNAEQNEASKEPEAETPQPEELQSEKPQSEVLNIQLCSYRFHLIINLLIKSGTFR